MVAAERALRARRRNSETLLMAERDLLTLPDDFEGNLRALLQTPPVPDESAPVVNRKRNEAKKR